MAPKSQIDNEGERSSGKVRSNADRVLEIGPALHLFVASHGIEGEEVVTQVGDLICDALHLCEARGGDQFRALRQGVGHYAAEVVCGEELGPDLRPDIKLNGLEPAEAIEQARQRVKGGEFR